MAERNERGEYVAAYKGGRMTGWERGMNTRRSNIDLPSDMLRSIVNCDVLTSGRIRRRRGIEQRIASAGSHSVFGTNERLYWATQNALMSCDVNYDPSVVASSTQYSSPISYVELHGVVYFSNEVVNGKIVNGLLQPWGIVPPLLAPTATSNDSGTLNREYQVTCTFVIKEDGVEVEESGAPLGVKVFGSDDGIITLTNIPQSSDARVTHTRIYAKDIDGTVFFAQVDVPATITTYMISRPFALGKKLTSQFMANPPAGHLIMYYNGRIYIAVDNILYFTDAIRYGAYDMKHGFIPYPERITVLKAVDDGFYISSDMTYFVKGTPEPGKISQSVVLPYKAIEGAACDMPSSTDVAWLSERGVIVGSDGGQVKNVTENQIAMDKTDRACMGVIETNGARRLVTIMRDSTQSPLVAEDYVEAEADRINDSL